MRLSLSVNGVSRIVAAINGPGYLDAHVNLRHRLKENDDSKTIRIVGTETHKTETIRSEWPSVDLRVGDEIGIRILKDGQSDAPSATRKSSEAAQNLFSNQALATELINVVADFESRLIELLRKSEESEPYSEHEKFGLAVAHVTAELGVRFLYPIYRRHPELVPEALNGELL